MTQPMRIRQVCLVAADLKKTLAHLERLFDAPVCFRDPGVAAFGLENGLLPVGGDFLEVVSPTRQDSAGARTLSRLGDSGYMVILQCADAAAARAHVEAQGVRAVWTAQGRDLPDSVYATHFHPRDVGGAILSIDTMGDENWAAPTSRWHWAGPDWRRPEGNPQATAKIGRIARVEISAPDPETLAAHWGRLLGGRLLEKSVESSGERFSIHLDHASLAFVRADRARAAFTGLAFHAGSEDPEAFYRRAVEIGLPVADRVVRVSGVGISVGAHGQ